MNATEAKRDATARLRALGISYARLSARTVSFSDLARAAPVFVTVHGATFPYGVNSGAVIVPRPSDGGYILQFD